MASPSEALFDELGSTSGFDFIHFNGRAGAFHFAEMMGSGAAVFDADGDGDLDLFLRQGNLLEAGQTSADALIPPAHDPPFTDRLYRNDLEQGALAFTDVTDENVPPELDPALPVAEGGSYGMGVATGDIDGDGDTDLYLTNFGPNRMLRNRGDGTFEDITATSGTGDLRWSVPAVFFDFDRDGNLDLYVGNYVDLSPATRKACYSETGARDYCGPAAFSGETDRLFHGKGDGTFEDVTAPAGLGATPAPTLGAITGDFNGDGWPDLYVANDGASNFLWINQGDGTFGDQALLGGCALNTDGLPEAGMGVDAGDFDGDGDEDIFLAHLTRETNTLYRNGGGGLFTDISRPAGLAGPSLDKTAFGAQWIDIDNDGRLDLLTANGAVKTIEALAKARDPFPLHQANQVFMQTQKGSEEGQFEDVSTTAGPAFSRSEVSRGAAIGDLDNDGDLDVLLTNNGGPARLLLNRVGQDQSWIGFRLLHTNGAGSTEGAMEVPTEAIGASVTVKLQEGEALWRRAGTSGSYASARDPRILIGLGNSVGLGKNETVQEVLVFWPDGSQEVWNDLVPGRYHTLLQGNRK